MAIGSAAPGGAPLRIRPVRSRGRLLSASPPSADAQRFPARPRPHHPFDRLPPADAQDAGVRLPRGRPLPHPADPHARGGADRPLAGPRARRSTRTWPRRWRSATTSAIRPSAMPASARSTRAMAAFGGFDHNAQTLRIVTGLERRYAALRRAQPDLGDARGPRQAQRPADRSRRRRRSAAMRARAAARHRRLLGAAATSSSGAMPSAEAQVAAHRRRHRLQRPRHRRRPARRAASRSTTSTTCR